jgi:hypothetical protein
LLASRGARDSAVAACDQRPFTTPELDEEATTFIPAAFGSWQIKTGVNVLHLGGNLRDVNKDRDRTEIIGTVGLAFTY